MSLRHNFPSIFVFEIADSIRVNSKMIRYLYMTEPVTLVEIAKNSTEFVTVIFFDRRNFRVV